MVEWCDDERDTRSAYHSKSKNENDTNEINAGTLAKQIAQQEAKAKTGMGYNESVYVEYKYESLVKVQPADVDYKPQVVDVNEPTETNETLLQDHKFADM